MTRYSLNIEFRGESMYLVTEEALKLWKETKPWRNGAALKEDAPEDIKQKAQKIITLMKQEEQRQIALMFK